MNKNHNLIFPELDRTKCFLSDVGEWQLLINMYSGTVDDASSSVFQTADKCSLCGLNVASLADWRDHCEGTHHKETFALFSRLKQMDEKLLKKTTTKLCQELKEENDKYLFANFSLCQTRAFYNHFIKGISKDSQINQSYSRAMSCYKAKQQKATIESIQNTSAHLISDIKDERTTGSSGQSLTSSCLSSSISYSSSFHSLKEHNEDDQSNFGQEETSVVFLADVDEAESPESSSESPSEIRFLGDIDEAGLDGENFHTLQTSILFLADVDEVLSSDNIDATPQHKEGDTLSGDDETLHTSHFRGATGETQNSTDVEVHFDSQLVATENKQKHTASSLKDGSFVSSAQNQEDNNESSAEAQYFKDLFRAGDGSSQRREEAKEQGIGQDSKPDRDVRTEPMVFKIRGLAKARSVVSRGGMNQYIIVLNEVAKIEQRIVAGTTKAMTQVDLNSKDDVLSHNSTGVSKNESMIANNFSEFDHQKSLVEVQDDLIEARKDFTLDFKANLGHCDNYKNEYNSGGTISEIQAEKWDNHIVNEKMNADAVDPEPKMNLKPLDHFESNVDEAGDVSEAYKSHRASNECEIRSERLSLGKYNSEEEEKKEGEHEQDYDERLCSTSLPYRVSPSLISMVRKKCENVDGAMERASSCVAALAFMDSF